MPDTWRRRPDGFLRDQPPPRRAGVPPRQQPPQLLRQVAASIRQAVLELHHDHRADLARSGSTELQRMADQIREALNDAVAAPLSFIERVQMGAQQPAKPGRTAATAPALEDASDENEPANVRQARRDARRSMR